MGTVWTELSERDELRYEVLYKGMTIEVIEQSPVAYQMTLRI